MTINEKILEAQIRHSIYLERYKSGVVYDIIGQLNAAHDDLAKRLAGRLALIEERGYDLGPAVTARLQRMLDEIETKTFQAYDQFLQSMTDQGVDFAKYEADFQVRLVNQAGASVNMVLPSDAQLKAIVTATPFQGKILADWTESLAAGEFSRVKVAVNLGITQNETIDQIVRRVRGTRAAGYSDGALSIGRRDAEAVIRTAISDVASAAKRELSKANADLVAAWKHHSTLDSRTSPTCQSLDGKVYRKYEDIRWPPLHWNCRSIITMFFDGDEAGKRASEFGPIPSDTTYGTFLRKQSKAFQEDVLGVERARIFRDSGADISKFVDNKGKYYTLDELKAKGF